MKRQFTDMEWEAIRGDDGNTEAEQLARFFRHWALKESYVKAVGTGLNIDLRTLNFTLGGEVGKGGMESGTKLSVDGNDAQWRFEESLVDKEHVVSVAVETEDEAQDGEPFKVLDIHRTATNKTMTNNDLEKCSSPLLWPLDPADFVLFSSKDDPKPF